MAISADALNKMVAEWANTSEGRAKMDSTIISYRKKGQARTAAGDDVVDITEMRRMADEFIQLLTMKAQSNAGNVPANVLSHFGSLVAEGPFQESDGSYTMRIRFTDDLSRNALTQNNNSETYAIDNIVALFNNGVSAAGYAYGWWEGHSSDPNDGKKVRSRKERPALHFIQDAISEFEAKYGTKYKLTAEPDVIYTYSPGQFRGTMGS